MTGALSGCRVVVCRAAEQAGDLVALLEAEGAEPVALPLIEVVPPLDAGAALAAAVHRLERYRWVLLTSANAARALAGAVGERPWPAAVPVATVGPATTAAAEAAGIPVALARPGGTGADLAAALPAPEGPGVVLLPAAEVARPELARGLLAVGWEVDQVVAYRSIRPPVEPAVLARVEAAHAVLFSAPSTIDRYLELAGPDVPPLVVCIGPTTAARAAERGLPVAAVAERQADAGLVAALRACWREGSGAPGAGPAPGRRA